MIIPVSVIVCQDLRMWESTNPSTRKNGNITKTIQREPTKINWKYELVLQCLQILIMSFSLYGLIKSEGVYINKKSPICGRVLGCYVIFWLFDHLAIPIKPYLMTVDLYL